MARNPGFNSTLPTEGGSLPFDDDPMGMGVEPDSLDGENDIFGGEIEEDEPATAKRRTHKTPQRSRKTAQLDLTQLFKNLRGVRVSVWLIILLACAVIFLTAYFDPQSFRQAFQAIADSGVALLDPPLTGVMNVVGGIAQWLVTYLPGIGLTALAVLLVREMLGSHAMTRGILAVSLLVAGSAAMLWWLFRPQVEVRSTEFLIRFLVTAGVGLVVALILRLLLGRLFGRGENSRDRLMDSLNTPDIAPEPAPSGSGSSTRPKESGGLATLAVAGLVIAALLVLIAFLAFFLGKQPVASGDDALTSRLTQMLAEPGAYTLAAVLLALVSLAAVVTVALRWPKSRGQCAMISIPLTLMLAALEQSVQPGMVAIHTGWPLADMLLLLLGGVLLFAVVHLAVQGIMGLLMDGTVEQPAARSQPEQSQAEKPAVARLTALTTLWSAFIQAVNLLVETVVGVIGSLFTVLFLIDFLDDTAEEEKPDFRAMNGFQPAGSTKQEPTRTANSARARGTSEQKASAPHREEPVREPDTADPEEPMDPTAFAEFLNKEGAE